MKIFAVYAPPAGSDAAEKTVLVKEGFSFLAFLFPLVWLAVYRAWRGLFIYLGVSIALGVFSYAVGLRPAGEIAPALVLSLYFGFEGAAYRQAALLRRGFHHAGSVLAASEIEAERRFFAAVTMPALAG